MEVLPTIKGFQRARRKIRGTLGLVPTMGYLHQGHWELVRHAKAENDAVAATIFVNPSQFGPNEDFEKYPRDLERDLAMFKGWGVDLVFTPSVKEMYPKGFYTWVEVGSLAHLLEGKSRPGHFRGVATIVTKLFIIAQADRAYFGQKDAQQLRVIRKMASDLNIPVEIVEVPTMREPDGLAMSSRNVYLSTDERKAATVLWKSLCLAQKLWSGGERNATVIRAAIRQLLNKEPLPTVDYISVADSENLEELEQIERPALVSLAVWIGKARLIDNITLNP